MLKREHVGFVQKTVDVGDHSAMPSGTVKLHAELRLTAKGFVSAREVQNSKSDAVERMKDVLAMKLWRELYGDLEQELTEARRDVLNAVGDPLAAHDRVFEVFDRLRKFIRWERS